MLFAQPGLAYKAGKHGMGEGQDPNILTEPDFTVMPTNQPTEINGEGFGSISFQGSIQRNLWVRVWHKLLYRPTVHDSADSNFLI